MFPSSRLRTVLFKFLHLDKIPFIGSILTWLTRSTTLIPKGTVAALSSISGYAPSRLSKLNPFQSKFFNGRGVAKRIDDEKFQAGEPYGDPVAVSSSLKEDLQAIGLNAATRDLQTLIEVFKSKGKPVKDREMTMEKMIALTASLPRNSTTRKKLTGIVIDTLWTSLQHPPMSYMGDKFSYRTPDGSFNNPLNPDLGKAGSPYARTVPKLKSGHGVPPDPGLLFDRNPHGPQPRDIQGESSWRLTWGDFWLTIFADIFRTNRFDNNKSDTSSYLDLAPLYGSSLEDQLAIRTMERGLLKPDTFHERRLIGQPPGINVILIMYSRFHNYVAEMLLRINEGGRFTLPPTETEKERKAALEKQDNDLFQTARLVVGGLYINICLHDYLRGLTNTHHSASDWTLDPRVAVNRLFDADGVPRGVGNQVSAEFNLMYRFHSTISQRDEKWINKFFSDLFPGLDKPLDQLTPMEFVQGLFRFEQSIDKDPGKREFGGLKRNADGKFNDADLVNVLKESMEDPAGLFGPRMVPKALRMVEIAGILTARKWNLASLNEMRDFFKLQRHTSFEDLNPDPEIADLLRKLYDHPDLVEMYPGLFLEDAKPRMDPGCGGCPPYTVGRAVFSDAVTLVRSDRFYTLDFTTSHLTNWGMTEVTQDLNVMGGSMFYKLIQRALPNWFPYNSLHIMQPMFTRKMNEQIAREIGTIDQYTLEGPSPPRRPVILTKHSTITKVLADSTHFAVPWAKPLNEMFPGKKDYSSFMLGGDKPENTAQRNLVGDVLYTPAEFKKLLSETTLAHTKSYLKKETLSLGKKLDQIDIIRDVAIPVLTRILADLFTLDLRTEENPKGTLGTAALYKALMDVRTFGFNDNDPAMSWRRRNWAREGATLLTETTVKSIQESSQSPGLFGKIGDSVNDAASKLPIIGSLVKKPSASGSLRWYGSNVVREIIAAGKNLEETADICWLTGVAGVGAPISMFADVMNFFFQRDNIHHWEKIQGLAADSSNEAADKTLRQYILEAQRFSSKLRNARVCTSATNVNGQAINAGDMVVCLFGPAGMDPEAVPEPEKFKLDRPASAYLHFGAGPHTCLGREVTLSVVSSLIKAVAGLKNLRPAPGDMGSLKNIQVGTERCYLNDGWSWLTFDPTTWKVHFEGYGKGVYMPPLVPVTEGRDLNAVFNALMKQYLKGPKGVTPVSDNKLLQADQEKPEADSKVPNGVKPDADAAVPDIAAGAHASEEANGDLTVHDDEDASGDMTVDEPASADGHDASVDLAVDEPSAAEGEDASGDLAVDGPDATDGADASGDLAVDGPAATGDLTTEDEGPTGDEAAASGDLSVGDGEPATGNLTSEEPEGVSTDGSKPNGAQTTNNVAESNGNKQNGGVPESNGTNGSSHPASNGASKKPDDASHPNGNSTAPAIQAPSKPEEVATPKAPSTAPAVQAPSKPEETVSPKKPSAAPAVQKPSKPVVKENPDFINIGRYSKSTFNYWGSGIGSYTEHVRFAKAHDKPPRIFLGFATLDFEVNSNPSFYQEARNVTTTGFDLVVNVESSKLWQLETVWVEIPDNEKHKNIVMGSFDSAHMKSSKSADGLSLNSAVLPFKELHGKTNLGTSGNPTVVTWLTGLSIDNSKRRGAVGAEVGARVGTNEKGEKGVVVSVKKPTSAVAGMPSARVNFIAFLPSENLGLSTGAATATFPNMFTKSVMVSASHKVPMQSVPGLRRFVYADQTSTIRLRVVNKQLNPTQTKYSVESWQTPSATEMAASIVMIPKYVPGKKAFAPDRSGNFQTLTGAVRLYVVRAMKVVAWKLVYDSEFDAYRHLRKQLDDAQFRYPVIAKTKPKSWEAFTFKLVDHLSKDGLIKIRRR
ncbi:hypothetical protein IWZ00DRAFT_541955 [Phyllosticta capitalensis]